jgi:hypothetical protein
MFIASYAIVAQAPEERYVLDVAPPELEIIPCPFLET